MVANTDLENMYETLNTIGWDLIADGFATQYEGCNQVVGCSQAKDMHFRLGQLNILAQILTLKEDVRTQMNEAIDGVEEDADL